MRNALARAAGGTLGFIAGNTRGLYFGQRFAARMAKRKPSNTAPRARKRPAPASKKKFGIASKPAAVRRAAKRIGAKRWVGKPKSRTHLARHSEKISHSLFKLGTGAKLFKGFKRQRVPTTFTATHTQRIESVGAGNQQVALLPTYRFNPSADVTTAEASQFTITKSLIDRFARWLNAWENAPAGTAPDATAGLTGWATGNSVTTKFVVNYLKYDTALRNMGNQDVSITLYDCVLRSGAYPKLRGTSPNDVLVPLDDWHDGMYYTYNPNRQTTVEGGTYQQPGVTPFMSPVFCKLYKITKVSKRVLPPGEVHHHHVLLRPRNMFNAIVDTSAQKYIPGLTGFTMVVVTGSIVHQDTNKNNISTAPTGLDVVTRTSGSVSCFSRERKQHLAFDVLTDTLATGAWRGVDEATDTIVNADV